MKIDRFYVFVLTTLFIYRQDIPYYFMTEVFQRVSFLYIFSFSSGIKSLLNSVSLFSKCGCLRLEFLNNTALNFWVQAEPKTGRSCIQTS